ncbi:unnamed protein product [Prorocentrum cordatum]|uniref:Uncharacterized protein n=1 Tax=Prorocentrum cordatum TaxID=2364126 RepID=A0ABN9Y6W9_9DINO|nr:unnamed protein product [Polarella glacialis]
MAGVAMDVAQFQREWAVAEGQGKPWLDAAAGGEAMPRAPRKTAQAASLLLRLTRALPRADLLRGMLEQLAEELVPAIYRDWPAHASLGDLSEADLQAESIDNMTPYFALVAGHRCLREETGNEERGRRRRPRGPGPPWATWRPWRRSSPACGGSSTPRRRGGRRRSAPRPPPRRGWRRSRARGPSSRGRPARC